MRIEHGGFSSLEPGYSVSPVDEARWGPEGFWYNSYLLIMTGNKISMLLLASLVPDEDQ